MKIRLETSRALALAAIGCGAALGPAPGLAAQERVAGDLTRETWALELPDGTPVEGEFGRLTVPENRAVPGSNLIEVAYVRLPGLAGASGPPTVYLQGGPGQTAVSSVRDPQGLDRWTALRQIGDVILMDQRGVGMSRPLLAYPWRGETPTNLFRSLEDAETHFVRQERAAAEHFRAEGFDLTGYTTPASADDLNDLRIALGLERVNLFGFSYGTHLALSVIRRHGEHVANAVLMGVEGPNHTYKLPSSMDTDFRKLALMAAADPEIARRIPDLNALLERVLERLDREPMLVTVIDRATGEPIEIPIGGAGLRFFLRLDIGDASDLPVFPRLLYSIDQGDSRLLEWFARKRFGAGSNGMSAVMDAASGATANRLARIRQEEGEGNFGRVVNFPYPDVGEIWGAPDLGDDYRSPIVSPVRTLFLTGTLDFNSPPYQAEEVRWGFPNSSHIIVKNAGHEQIIQHPEVQRAIIAFLRGENVDDRTAAFPPLRFVPLEGHDPEVTHPSVPR